MNEIFVNIMMIVDFEAEDAHIRKIGQVLAGCNVTSITTAPQRAFKIMSEERMRGIILAGGGGTVSRLPDPRILGRGVPVLAISGGMHWVAMMRGGQTGDSDGATRFGVTNVHVDEDCALFDGLARDQAVWINHQRCLRSIPPGFSRIANTPGGGDVLGICNLQERLLAVQFHPEDEQTPGGVRMIKNFVRHICGCRSAGEDPSSDRSCSESFTEPVA